MDGALPNGSCTKSRRLFLSGPFGGVSDACSPSDERHHDYLHVGVTAPLVGIMCYCDASALRVV